MTSRRRLQTVLDDVRAKCDVTARLELDPVGAVMRFRDPLDREIIGLVASGIAFGNVKTIRAKLEELIVRIGDAPHEKADDARALKRSLASFRHRVFHGDDIARLMIGARIVQKKNGTLGARFVALFEEHGELREALATFCDEIRTAGDLRTQPEVGASGAADGAKGTTKCRRGPAHLLPDPRAGSGVKRLLLYLRWMVRRGVESAEDGARRSPNDGTDLGQWDLPPRVLLIPVDTHIHKLARNLGLTSRKDLSWRTAEEITRALAVFDPEDPVKYDFSLCHMGMLQRCPSRRDPKRCTGCPVMPVCRHWSRERRREGA